MSEQQYDRSDLEAVRLKKVVVYLQAQQELNKLTKAHLNSVIANTNEAVVLIMERLFPSITLLSNIVERFETSSGRKKKVKSPFDEIVQENKELIKGLKDLTDLCSLDDIEGAAAISRRSIFENLKKQITRLDKALTRIKTSGNRLIVGIVNELRKLSDGLNDVVCHLQFQDITRQQLEIVCKYLDDSDQYIDLLCECVCRGDAHCEHICSVPEFDVDSIHKYYVMEIQREVHRQVRGGA
ncbi:MAG: hypothetical protein HQL06_05945 [Nitrospirae bacterium]|nr:hypothetical protein [Nitrospirota bacterium]